MQWLWIISPVKIAAYELEFDYDVVIPAQESESESFIGCVFFLQSIFKIKSGFHSLIFSKYRKTHFIKCLQMFLSIYKNGFERIA